jgi:hypothetical protein
MPSGKHIPLEAWEIIYHFHINQKKTADEIFAELCCYDSKKKSYRWLQDLCRLFDSDGEVKIRKHLSAAKSRKSSAGRPQCFSPESLHSQQQFSTFI